MLDTHCHLTFDQYRGRVDEVLADAAAAGVRGVITVSTTPDDARAALALAGTHDAVWCTAGFHPLYADDVEDREAGWRTLREIAAHPRCVAWGELGLDNHYDRPARPRQDAVLAEHLDLIERAAREDGLTLPVVVHCRDAVDELLAVFAGTGLDPARFVFHCFTGGPDDARKVLDFGAWISFTGVVTFRNAPEVAAAAALVPADRIMVETDAPFLTPEPHRKVRPNEPKFVVDVARFIAGVRGEEPGEFERVLDANAERFFSLKLP
jgi:TatD DNase family protein